MTTRTSYSDPGMAPSTNDSAAGFAQQLVEKFSARQATVGVVGLGYVGLPMAPRDPHNAGFKVVGYDIDAEKIRKLRAGEPYLKHLGEELVKTLAPSSRFQATSQPTDLRSADAIILCVPTPLGKHQDPDLGYVSRSTEMVAAVLRPGMIVSARVHQLPGHDARSLPAHSSRRPA